MSCKQNWNEEIWVHGGKNISWRNYTKHFVIEDLWKKTERTQWAIHKVLCERLPFLIWILGSFDALSLMRLLNLWKILVTITHVGFIIWFRTDVKVKDLTRRGRVGIQSVTDMSKKFSHNNGSTWQVHSCRTSVICTLTYSQNSRQTPCNGCISRNLTNLL